MPRPLRVLAAALLATAVAAAFEGTASAAPRWVDRPMTLPRLVFQGDVGLGLGGARYGYQGAYRTGTGPGLNLEGAIGITDDVELGLRTGVRMGDDARYAGADAFGRTLWTETYGTGADSFANPEVRVRWRFYSGDVAEIGLDGRLYLPFETGTRLGTMIGVPLALHAARFLRIDTGIYVPIVFYDEPLNVISVPAYFWFQPSEKLWLGPMAALRSWDPGPFDRRTDLLLGFGLGYQVADAVDLKTMIFFPRINDWEGARSFGAGFGVAFRIGD